VKIYITSGLDGIKELPSEMIEWDLGIKDFDLRINGLNKKNLRLKVPNLQNEISVCQSMYKVKSNSISITLTKVKKNEKWTDIHAKKDLLGAHDKDLQKATNDISTNPASPSTG